MVLNTFIREQSALRDINGYRKLVAGQEGDVRKTVIGTCRLTVFIRRRAQRGSSLYFTKSQQKDLTQLGVLSIGKFRTQAIANVYWHIDLAY